ncbi:hypothetical protein FSHL1_006831 [Fusarium sambucinum]
MASTRHVYSALTNSKNIRLLRLSPSTSFSDRIEGYLFEYTLSRSGKNAHLYEALSYTWGAPDRGHSIWIEGNELLITANCHAALSQLRDDLLDRIVWIDAICIDQKNKDERGTQVQLMAEIYCKARQVIVWLGEATPETECALEHIRTAAEESEGSALPECQAVVALLQRPWFRRIWVLQEVAAARHVIVACGATQIDGYAFCLGLPPCVYEDSSSAAVRSIEFLIRRSIFRPKYTQDASGRVALGNRPLGELMDMYHSHEATEPLDRVFALLGMSTDGLSAHELVPNYNTPWHVLFGRLINFILGPKVSVKTFVDRNVAVICGKGTVIGKVVSVSSNFLNRNPQATISYAKDFQTLGSTDTWTFHPAVESVACGDLLCWLDGARNPMVIRPLKTHSSVILVSNHDTNSRTTRDSRLQSWLGDKVLSFAEPCPQKSVREGDLFRNVAQILAAADQYEDAAVLFDNASVSYSSLRGKDDLLMISCLEELARAREDLKQWAAAKDLWEFILRRSYAIQLGIPEIIAFSNKLLGSLKHYGYKYEESKWRTALRIIQAKQYGIPLTDDKILEMTFSYDSEIINILFDQWNDEVCVNERLLIAAAQNESHGASVMEVLLNRSNPKPKITEQILIAAAGNNCSGDKLITILLGRADKKANIMKDLFKIAASNRGCNRNLVQFLLAQEGITVDLDCITDESWLNLALFLTADQVVSSRATAVKQTMFLVRSFSKLDDTSILQLIFSVTDPNILSWGNRELLEIACETWAFRHLRLFIQMGRPCLTDIIHTVAYALLWHDESVTSKLLDVFTCRYRWGDDPLKVAEEVVNGCSRIVEFRTPARLSAFLDALKHLEISSECHVWFYTQSAILPAVVSDDQSFLKILIERKIVHVRVIPLSLAKMNRKYYEWAPELDEDICETTPAGMPDWPLYCAIVFVRDVRVLRYLCRAGARLNCDFSAKVRDQEEPLIIATLRHQVTLEAPRAKFAEAISSYIHVANVAKSTMKTESTGPTVDWPYESFPQAWTSMRNILQRNLSLQRTLQHHHSLMYEDFSLHTWPEPLSNEDSWKRWRDEAITTLSNEYYGEASNGL